MEKIMIDYEKMENISIYNTISTNLYNVSKLIDSYGESMTLKEIKEYLQTKQIEFMHKIASK